MLLESEMCRDIKRQLEVTKRAIAVTKSDPYGLTPDILAITLATCHDMKVYNMKTLKIMEISTSSLRLNWAASLPKTSGSEFGS